MAMRGVLDRFEGGSGEFIRIGDDVLSRGRFPLDEPLASTVGGLASAVESSSISTSGV